MNPRLLVYQSIITCCVAINAISFSVIAIVRSRRTTTWTYGTPVVECQEVNGHRYAASCVTDGGSRDCQCVRSPQEKRAVYQWLVDHDDSVAIDGGGP